VKIVVAIPYAPWPITKGTDRLILNLLDGLAVNHEVVLVTMALGAPELARLREIERPRVGVRAIVAPHRRGLAHKFYYKARNIASALFEGVPPQVSYAAPGEYLRLVADTARDIGADLVLPSYWHLYRLPELLPDLPLALITHDLDFLVNTGRLNAARGLARWRAALGARMLERIERRAYESYERILTVTPADAETLGRQPFMQGKPVDPLPLALDLSVFNPATFERERDLVLFLGTFYSDFNRDAFRFFTGEIFPIIKGRNPAARLEVVGQGVDERMRAAAQTDVVFTGGVEDIRPYVGRCALMVLPLRFAGGVRIRMMEAAAMGTPVVSTPVGVAGMGLQAGSEYLEASSALDFAGAVARLLDDPGAAGRLGMNARAWAERNISMESYPGRLEALLRRIVPRS
jgi:polysaccharide biosynthesis protein PslH